jgi:hypothetical protein
MHSAHDRITHWKEVRRYDGRRTPVVVSHFFLESTFIDQNNPTRRAHGRPPNWGSLKLDLCSIRVVVDGRGQPQEAGTGA